MRMVAQPLRHKSQTMTYDTFTVALGIDLFHMPR